TTSLLSGVKCALRLAPGVDVSWRATAGSRDRSSSEYSYSFCCPAALAVSSSDLPSGLIDRLPASTPTGIVLARVRMSSKIIDTFLAGRAAGAGDAGGEDG